MKLRGKGGENADLSTPKSQGANILMYLSLYSICIPLAYFRLYLYVQFRIF